MGERVIEYLQITKISSGVLVAGVRCRLVKIFIHITPILENI
jgi:hypothetical protein